MFGSSDCRSADCASIAMPHRHWKTTTLYTGCAMMASPPRSCWMVRWMDPTCWPISNRSNS